MAKENWPETITEDENSEFLKKIKVEYITSAKFERMDEYYEYSASDWGAYLSLDVDGQKSRVVVYESCSDWYAKFEKMLANSLDFDCDSEVPEQIGRITYTRKEK